MIDRTKEKIVLMEEMGMMVAADDLKVAAAQKEAAKKDVEELTDLKFPLITDEAIEKKISKRYYDWDYASRDRSNADLWDAAWILLFVGGLLGGMIGLIIATSISHIFFGAMSGLVPSTCIFLYALSRGYVKTDIKSRSVENWRGNLPYGALLAMKEAKDKGIRSFRIFYPVRKKTMERLPVDPVLVGFTRRANLMVEIFSWDDGQIYE